MTPDNGPYVDQELKAEVERLRERATRAERMLGEICRTIGATSIGDAIETVVQMRSALDNIHMTTSDVRRHWSAF